MLNNFNNFKPLDLLKNIFKPPTQTQQTVSYGGVQPISGYNFQPYQVKPGDTFDQIAKNNGLDVPSIQKANNGMLVPPPKGSYINLPGSTPQNNLGPAFGPPKPLGYGAPVGYGPFYQNKTPLNAPASPGLGANSFTAGKNVNVLELVPQLTQQLSTGAMPPIPTQAQQKLINPQTGKPITDAELGQMGYQYDNQTQTWRAPGQGGAAQLPAGQVATGSAEFMNTGFMQQYAEKGTPFLQQKRWDPTTKKFQTIGTLLKQGKLSIDGKKPKKRGGGGGGQTYVAPPPPPESTNSGGNPSQNLNTNRGGG
jgi:LysM domain.